MLISVSWFSTFSEKTHIWKKHYAAQCKSHTCSFGFSKPSLFRGVSGTLDQWTLHPHKERGRCWQVRSVITQHALSQKFRVQLSVSVCSFWNRKYHSWLVLLTQVWSVIIVSFSQTWCGSWNNHIWSESCSRAENDQWIMVSILVCQHKLQSAAVMAFFFFVGQSITVVPSTKTQWDY